MAKRIVVLGAGIAGAQALRSLHKVFHGDTSVSLSVIDRVNHSVFIPMIHEVATGSVEPLDLAQPIREIVHCCLTHFHMASVKNIDLEQRIVQTDDGPVEYDYLVVAIGSKNNFFGVPGVEEHTLRLKTLQDALKLRERIIDRFEAVSKLSTSDPHRRDKLHFVIIGAGYTGVETAGQLADLFRNEMAELYPEIAPDEPKVTIVQSGDRILPVLSPSSSAKAVQRLERMGVHIRTGVRATAVTDEGVTLNNGEILQSHNIVWTSGILARGGEIIPESYLEKGRIRVRSTLQMEAHPEVFAVGDIAAVMEGNGPHPQTAQAATEQAKTIGLNLKRLIEGEPLEPFFYSHKGDLVPIGERWAVAEIKGFKFSGFFAWWIRRTVYLMGIFSWADRARVIFSWTMKLFSKRDTTRL